MQILLTPYSSPFLNRFPHLIRRQRHALHSGAGPGEHAVADRRRYRENAAFAHALGAVRPRTAAAFHDDNLDVLAVALKTPQSRAAKSGSAVIVKPALEILALMRLSWLVAWGLLRIISNSA